MAKNLSFAVALNLITSGFTKGANKANTARTVRTVREEGEAKEERDGSWGKS